MKFRRDNSENVKKILERFKKLYEESTSTEELNELIKEMNKLMEVKVNKVNANANNYVKPTNQHISTLKNEKNQLNLLLYIKLLLISIFNRNNIHHIYNKYRYVNLPKLSSYYFNTDYSNVSKCDISNIPVEMINIVDDELNRLLYSLLDRLYNLFEIRKYI